MNSTPIEIPLSKKKMIVSLLGCLAFCAIGILFIFKSTQFDNPVFVQIIGGIALLFFGAIAITI
ncbi:MAG: hypothetical protein HC854_17505 [Flavobacterium sp.]|nr:hypothetical protein [Flavobacterium sp.]